MIMLNKEIFFLEWDSNGLQKAAQVAAGCKIPLGICLGWVKERSNGKTKAAYHSRMLRQAGTIALRRV